MKSRTAASRMPATNRQMGRNTAVKSSTAINEATVRSSSRLMWSNAIPIPHNTVCMHACVEVDEYKVEIALIILTAKDSKDEKQRAEKQAKPSTQVEFTQWLVHPLLFLVVISKSYDDWLVCCVCINRNESLHNMYFQDMSEQSYSPVVFRTEFQSPPLGLLCKDQQSK